MLAVVAQHHVAQARRHAGIDDHRYAVRPRQLVKFKWIFVAERDVDRLYAGLDDRLESGEPHVARHGADGQVATGHRRLHCRRVAQVRLYHGHTAASAHVVQAEPDRSRRS